MKNDVTKLVSLTGFTLSGVPRIRFMDERNGINTIVTWHKHVIRTAVHVTRTGRTVWYSPWWQGASCYSHLLCIVCQTEPCLPGNNETKCVILSSTLLLNNFGIASPELRDIFHKNGQQFYDLITRKTTENYKKSRKFEFAGKTQNTHNEMLCCKNLCGP